MAGHGAAAGGVIVGRFRITDAEGGKGRIIQAVGLAHAAHKEAARLLGDKDWPAWLPRWQSAAITVGAGAATVTVSRKGTGNYDGNYSCRIEPA